MVDTSTLPALDISAYASPGAGGDAPAGTQSNPVFAGLKSGVYGALSGFAGAVAAGAKAIGYDQGAANAEARAQDLAASEQASGRSDLEEQGLTGGGFGGAAKYLAYKGAQFLPQLVGGAAVGAALPEVAAGGLLARAGAAVPSILGGGGGLAGEAALSTGATFARGILGGAAVMSPLSIGEQYNAASKQDGGATQGDALKSIALGVPLGALQSVGFHGLTPAGGALGVAQNALTHAAAFGFGSSLQTAANDSYDPSLSASQRAENIGESFLSGAVAGGFFGAAHGAAGNLFGKPPASTSNQDLTKAVDAVTQPPGELGGGQAPDLATQPVHNEPRQMPLDLGNIYRTGNAPGAQGDLFQPSGLGRAPDGPMPDLTPDDPTPQHQLDRLASVLGRDTSRDAGADYDARAAEVAGGVSPSPPTFDPQDFTPSTFGKRTPEQLQEILARLRSTPQEAREVEGLTDDQTAALQALGGSDAKAPVLPTTDEPQEGVQPRSVQDATLPSASSPENTSQAHEAKASLFAQFGDDGQAIGPRGTMRDWINSTTVTSEPELYNRLEDELKANSKVSKTAGFKRMAQDIGLLNDDGKPLDLATERADAANIPNQGARDAEMARLDAIEQRRDAGTMMREPQEVTPLGPKQDAFNPLEPYPDGSLPVGSEAPRPAFEDDGSLERDRRRIQQAFPGQERRGATPATADLAPAKSIASRVVDAAHELTGGTGGEARIADIRAKLPDVAGEDIDNALRQVHGDDSDSTLTQAPAGRRKGVDGVSVQGQGKFHNLSVEPREATDAVQERGATPENVADRSAGGAEDGSGDAARGEVADAQRVEGGDGQPQRAGATQETPAQDREVRPQDKSKERRKIEQAMRVVSGNRDGVAVNLDTIRDRTSLTMTRAEQDKGLGEILRDPKSRYNLMRHDDPKQITPEMARAAYNPAGDPFHTMMSSTVPKISGAGKAIRAVSTSARRQDNLPKTGEVMKSKALVLPVRTRAADGTSISGDYPGDEMAARKLGIDLPEKFKGTDVYDAVTDRLPLLWDRAVKGDFDSGEGDYYGLYKDTQSKFGIGGRANILARRPDGTLIPSPHDSIAASIEVAADRLGVSPQSERALKAGMKDRIAAAKAARDDAAVLDPLRQVPPSVRPKETVNDAGATELPAETVGATPRDLAAELSTPREQLLPPPEARIMPKMAFDPGNELGRVGIMDPVEAKSAFDNVVKNFAAEDRGNMRLIRSAAELPQDVVRAAQSQGLDITKSPGLYMGGKVYVRADMMRSAGEIEDVLSHEALGHYATAKLAGFGKGNVGRVDAVMDKMAELAGGPKGIEALARKYDVWDGDANGNDGLGLKAYYDAKLSPGELMDELFAHAAASKTYGKDMRGTLAIIGRFKQALAEMLNNAGLTTFAKKFETFGVADVEKYLADTKAALQGEAQPDKLDISSLPDLRVKYLGERSFALDRGERISPILSGPPRDQNERISGVQRALSAVLPKAQGAKIFSPAEFARTARKAYLTVQTKAGMERSYNSILPELTPELELNKLRQNLDARFNGYHNPVNVALRQFKQASPRAYEALSSILHEGSLAQIDPTKTFAQNTHLHDAPNADLLKAKNDELNTLWNKLGQSFDKSDPGAGQKLYRRTVLNSETDRYASNATAIYKAVRNLAEGSNIPGFEKSPLRDYERQTALHSNPEGTHAYFKGVHDDLQGKLNDYIGKASVDPILKGSDQLQSLKDVRDAVKESISDQAKAPYIHLGRQGDYFGSFRFKRAEDGVNADPKAVQSFHEAMEAAGLRDVALNSIGPNRDVFTRFETQEQAQLFRDLVLKNVEHTDPTVEPRGGLIDQDFDKTNSLPIINRMLDAVRSKFDGDDENTVKARDQAVNELRATMLDLMPTQAMGQVMSRRAGVQGYSTKLLDNKVFHDQVVSRGLASGQTNDDIADLSNKMRQRVRDATVVEPGNPAKLSDAVKIADVYKAYLDRNAAQTTRVQNSYLDTVRGVAHTYFLGASPGYAVMQVMQPMTLTMPELAKKYGAVRSVGALVSVQKDAFKILGAMAAEHGSFLAGKNPDYVNGITQKVIDRSGVSKEVAEHVMNMTNAGHLELGTFARSMGGDALDRGKIKSKVARALAMANATASGSETLGRLVSGLAAKKLYDLDPSKAKEFDDANHYAGHVIANGMMTWGGYNTSRLFSAGGPLGAAGPLMFQFHSFSSQLFEKVWHETYNAFKGETPESKAEARRFIMAHAAAVTAISGSLGLPAAGWAAGAITRLSSMLPGSGGEAYDVEAHYRDFLASMFGDKVGAVLAHGLPHFLNTDMSELGDSGILPFTSLLEDRRKLEDAFPAYLAHAWGSSVGAGLNIALGARDMANGRVSEGMARMLPTAARNIVKAYRIGEYGYTDSKGLAMPIKADAVDVIKQALGLNSAALEEQREMGRSAQGAKLDRTYHSGIIKQNIAVALERGDNEGAQRWMQEAANYDADPRHAGSPISTTIPSYLESRRRSVAVSQSTGLPTGISARDLPTMKLLSYGREQTQ